MERKNARVAYPFLKDLETLQTDFELLTDEVASLLGVAQHFVEFVPELKWLLEWTYHLNGSIRGVNAITPKVVDTLLEYYHAYEEKIGVVDAFVLPQGSVGASHLHVLRVKFKEIVRLLHRINQEEKPVPTEVLDFANIASNVLFLMALYENKQCQIEEVHFVSKSYL